MLPDRALTSVAVGICIKLTLVVPYVFVWLLSCTQPKKDLRDVPLRGWRVAKNVSLSDVVEGRMQVEHRSGRSVRGCAIQDEVRELWDSFIRMEAERSRSKTVLIWPQDESRSARAFEYSRANDGDDMWKEASGFLPCK